MSGNLHQKLVWCLRLNRETEDSEFGVEEKPIVTTHLIQFILIVYQGHAFIFQLNGQNVL